MSDRPVSDSPLLFLKKFLRHGTRVASVAPSSRSLAVAMCQYVDAAKPQVLVEVGAGTGAVTKVIAEKMHPDSKLFAIELDADFARILRDVVPKATVLELDAAKAVDELAKVGVEKADVVLSGLPMPSLPKQVAVGVLESYRKLAGDSVFSQLTVMPYIFQGFYRKLFHDVEFTPVWANIPPGGVYHCRRIKGDYANHLKH